MHYLILTCTLSSTCAYSRLHKIVKYFTSRKMLYMILPFLCVTMLSLFQSSHCYSTFYRKVSYTLPGVSFYLTCKFPCQSFTMFYLTLPVKNDNTHWFSRPVLPNCNPLMKWLYLGSTTRFHKKYHPCYEMMVRVGSTTWFYWKKVP